MPSVVIVYDLDAGSRQVLAEALDGAADTIYLTDLNDTDRADALRKADAVLARTTRELHQGEIALLKDIRLLQFINAGIDFVPLADLPPGVPVATNGGAYAEPMAEHALAMALAAAKRLLPEHAALSRGEFNQFNRNRMLAGGVCGILGFGGIGVAMARLARGIGMKVHAINRRGRSEEPTDWIGTTDQLDMLLAASDLLVIATPLTPATLGLIGAQQLARMKQDAIVVNLARGEIIDERALYEHLVANPRFMACIDAWWIEPVRHGEFRMDQPFLSLPNVIGSPHNSAAAIAGTGAVGLQRATTNIKRALAGEAPLYLVPPEDRMM
ncbi:MAG TPA: NAD(P)-dependent oxidoreductase [Acetobacteraceae bacterium]|jgi:phosphoglycerate dehydrogenase-like enzyme|nr:NAD(P)-dependent oxidoreductase [Acetobacteraceae bacterium]